MNRLFSIFLYGAFHGWIKRDQKISRYREFSKTQWLTRDEINTLQLNKLRELLTHAGNHSSYYRSHFKKIGFDPNKIQSLSEISRLPFLTKSSLRENLEDLVCTDADPRFSLRNSTSGSTGEKTVFYSDRRAEQIKAPLVRRAYEWVGISLADRELRLWGAHFDVAKSKELKERLFNWLKNRAVLSAYALDDASLSRMLQYINAFRPDFLFSYPSSLAHLCDYMDRSGIFPYSPPKGIFTSGEQLYDWQKERVEKKFKTQVYNFYGCREVGIIAQECDRRSGLHLVPESVLVEIVDDNGRPVAGEEEGEIVVTDLCNFVMPFIRYRVGDRGRILSGGCSCGRNGLARIALEGRTFDIVHSPTGNAVGGTFWTLLLRSRPGIYKFQVIQDRLDHIRIDYIPENKRPLDEKEKKYFLEKISEKLKGIEIEFNDVKSIPIPDSGKMRFVVSLLD